MFETSDSDHWLSTKHSRFLGLHAIGCVRHYQWSGGIQLEVISPWQLLSGYHSFQHHLALRA